MAKNQFRIDTSGMESLLMKLQRMEHATARETADAVLQPLAEKINADTRSALAPQFLPAHGKYSKNPSKTEASIETDTSVRWEGMTAWIPVGFDFNKPGAGGYLISGTPRMAPDRELRRMYRQKAYMNGIQKELWDALVERISAALEE